MAVRNLFSADRSVPVTRGENPLINLQEEMNRLFDNFFGGSFLPASWAQFQPIESITGITPAIDVKENDKNIKITAELPGLEAKDVQIQVADHYVTIKGKKEDESKEEKDGYYRKERSYGEFQRVIALPDSANGDKAEASLNKGLLTITVPKKPGTEAKPRNLEIKQVA